MENLCQNYHTLKKQMSKYLLKIILFVIIISGIWLRFYDLGAQSYWMDEGYTINAVLSVMEHGNTILDSGQNYFCPLYCYPTALIADVLGQNAIAYRLLSAMLGALLILVAYFVMKKLFDRNSALLAAFFVSLSYWQIAWSRQARWYTLLILLFWSAIYFFYQFLRADKLKQRVIYFSSALITSILAIITHRIAYLLVPIFFVLWLIKTLKDKNKVKINKKLVFLAFFVVVLAISILELSLNFGISRALIANFNLYYELPYYLSFFLTNYWLFIFLALYAYFSAPKEDKIKHLLFLLPFLAYLLIFSFFTNIVHYRYLLAPALGFLLLGAVGAIDIFRKLWRKYKIMAIIFIIAIIAIFFISGQGVWRPLPFYTLENDRVILGNQDRPYWGYTPQPNFNGAYEVIAKNLKPEEIVISSHPQFNKIFLREPGYWLKYDYLGFEDKFDKITDDHEFYVNAPVIDDLVELKEVTAGHHGYIVFDEMSATGRIAPEIINYIRNSFKRIYFNEVNEYSKIWIYQF